MESTYNTEDTIAALATPWGTSALAVIRASGSGCIDALASMFRPSDRLQNAAGSSTVHGTVIDPELDEPLDEVVALVFRAPKSYTGEDCVDITCHGSLPGIAAILEAMRKIGFRDAGPGEFTLRAFLNRKMDLTKAEAVREIVDAKSKKAHVMALRRLAGSIERRVEALRGNLLELSARIELILDYPDDELDEEPTVDLTSLDATISDIEMLLATYNTGRLFQEGVRVAIAGKTNAGKSSLFNLFLREDRSIVSEVHGTTRDYIESWISLRGIPISLYDTAGLRAGLDPIEKEGIRRAGTIIENADLVIYLVDASEGFDDDDRTFLAEPEVRDRCIPVWNKIDSSNAAAPEGLIPLSAEAGTGFNQLEDAIADFFLSGAHTSDAAIIDSERQRDCLTSAVSALRKVREGFDSRVPLDAIATDLKDALDAFGELSGQISSFEILETMFSRFCVGK